MTSVADCITKRTDGSFFCSICETLVDVYLDHLLSPDHMSKMNQMKSNPTVAITNQSPMSISNMLSTNQTDKQTVPSEQPKNPSSKRKRSSQSSISSSYDRWKCTHCKESFFERRADLRAHQRICTKSKNKSPTIDVHLIPTTKPNTRQMKIGELAKSADEEEGEDNATNASKPQPIQPQTASAIVELNSTELPSSDKSVVIDISSGSVSNRFSQSSGGSPGTVISIHAFQALREQAISPKTAVHVPQTRSSKSRSKTPENDVKKRKLIEEDEKPIEKTIEKMEENEKPNEKPNEPPSEKPIQIIEKQSNNNNSNNNKRRRRNDSRKSNSPKNSKNSSSDSKNNTSLFDFGFSAEKATKPVESIVIQQTTPTTVYTKRFITARELGEFSICCPECNYPCVGDWDLTNHMCEKHPKMLNTCAICPKTVFSVFANKETFLHHMKMHEILKKKKVK